MVILLIIITSYYSYYKSQPNAFVIMMDMYRIHSSIWCSPLPAYWHIGFLIPYRVQHLSNGIL